MQYAVGQKLWLVPEQYALNKTPQEVTIRKVGRKWAEYAIHGTCYRVEIGKVVVDGGQYGSPGTLWASKAAWEHHISIMVAWADFARRLTASCPPEGITLEDIAAARKLCKLPPQGKRP